MLLHGEAGFVIEAWLGTVEFYFVAQECDARMLHSTTAVW